MNRSKLASNSSVMTKMELARIRRRIRERNNMFFNYFDEILKEMIPYCCDDMTPKQLVDYAKETARLIVEAVDEHQEVAKIVEIS